MLCNYCHLHLYSTVTFYFLSPHCSAYQIRLWPSFHLHTSSVIFPAHQEKHSPTLPANTWSSSPWWGEGCFGNLPHWFQCGAICQCHSSNSLNMSHHNEFLPLCLRKSLLHVKSLWWILEPCRWKLLVLLSDSRSNRIKLCVFFGFFSIIFLFLCWQAATSVFPHSIFGSIKGKQFWHFTASHSSLTFSVCESI